jgi:hypothetical protein
MPHGAIEEVLPGLYFVTGTMKMPGPMPVRFSRNMTIIREGQRLVLVNSVRLDEAGLAALSALGTVTDVVRLAGNHGMDDPFYKERYGATVWVVRGQRYTAGFDTNAKETYLTPDREVGPGDPLPVADGRLVVLDSNPPEGLLLLERNGGVVIAGDCLQHWAEADAYFNLPARLVMRAMGFLVPYNIGPAWLKQCKPPKAQLRGILDLPFRHVLPSHGKPVIDDAVPRYRPVIERVTS